MQPQIKASPQKVGLGDKLDAIYEMCGSIETTCCRQCSCCRVACPQMKYAEALRIVTKIWNEWSQEDKAELLITSVKYFFSKSLIKPCPLLSGSECRVYKERPLNCRMYGLFPEDMWNRKIDRMALALGLSKEHIPLNVQCPLVKLKKVQCPVCSSAQSDKDKSKCTECNGTGWLSVNPLTEEQIEKIYAALDELDRQILVSGKTSRAAKDKVAAMVSKQWNSRVLHDWILYFFWGEERLSEMTKHAMQGTEEQLADLMAQFEKIVRSKDFSVPNLQGVKQA